jgi:hypothetical protein
MERSHLQIYFLFSFLTLSAVRCESGAASDAPLTPGPSPTRGIRLDTSRI